MHIYEEQSLLFLYAKGSVNMNWDMAQALKPPKFLKPP